MITTNEFVNFHLLLKALQASERNALAKIRRPTSAKAFSFLPGSILKQFSLGFKCQNSFFFASQVRLREVQKSPLNRQSLMIKRPGTVFEHRILQERTIKLRVMLLIWRETYLNKTEMPVLQQRTTHKHQLIIPLNKVSQPDF